MPLLWYNHEVKNYSEKFLFFLKFEKIQKIDKNAKKEKI